MLKKLALATVFFTLNVVASENIPNSPEFPHKKFTNLVTQHMRFIEISAIDNRRLAPPQTPFSEVRVGAYEQYIKGIQSKKESNNEDSAIIDACNIIKNNIIKTAQGDLKI